MSDEYLTPKEIRFMKHTLGLDNVKYSYRNYFYGENNTGEELIEKGFVVSYSVKHKYQPTYHITEKGIKMLKRYIGNFKTR